MPQVRAIVGCCTLLFVAWLLSTNRRRPPIRCLVGGLSLQFLLALLVLRTDIGIHVFTAIGDMVAVVLKAGENGARFVFGNLVDVAPDRWGFVFMAKALPNIILFSALSAIGYHLRVLQLVVAMMAYVMRRLMGTGGAESLSAAANVFMGQTEAPLMVRPYIGRMTTSELNAVMVGGFATIAGSLMAVYAGMLGHEEKEAIAHMARHLLTASLISAPAGLVVAKIMIPEKDPSHSITGAISEPERETRNVIDAAATGALEGLKLALNVGAMLIAFIAIIALLDHVLMSIGQSEWIEPLVRWMGMPQLTLDGLLGLLFAPVAWLIGIPSHECRVFGSLLGQAMAVNEFISYKALAGLTAQQAISPRSATLAVYALCGFANFSSIAIQIAGIGGIAPHRRADLARLGLRAMFGGALSCWITACVAGMLIP